MQLTDDRISAFSALFLFAFITCLLPWFPGLRGDVGCWIGWSTYITNHGIGNAYESGSNYMPLYHYFLWFYGKLAGSPEAIKAYIPYLRTFTILFDFWGLWMVCKWGKMKMSYTVLMLISVVNISYYYNSVIWGQVDGIVAALVFAMLYAGWKRNLLLSGIACVLAVNMKLQAIIFIPLWGILVLDTLIARGGLKKTGIMLSGMAVAQGIILLPYIVSKRGIEPIQAIIHNATETYPVVSKSAINFWFCFLDEPMFVSDTDLVTNNLSYRDAGLMLFFIGSFLAMLPLLRILLQRFLNRTEEAAQLPKEQIWLSAALVGLLFFFFNTQMHERYSHPAFIFITVYCFSRRRFIPYILFSIAYFVNLELVLAWLDIGSGYNFFIFDHSIVVMLFTATIVYLYVLLIREVRQYKKATAHIAVVATAVPLAKPVKKAKKAK